MLYLHTLSDLSASEALSWLVNRFGLAVFGRIRKRSERHYLTDICIVMWKTYDTWPAKMADLLNFAADGIPHRRHEKNRLEPLKLRPAFRAAR